MHIVLPCIKVIARHTVTNHCKQIDTYYSQKHHAEVMIGRQCQTCGTYSAWISPLIVADKFAINKTTLYRLKAEFEEECTLKRKKGSGRSSTTSQEQGEEIFQAYEDDLFLIPALRPLQLQMSVPKLSDNIYENTD